MYAAGLGTKPWRAARAGGPAVGRRVLVVAGTLVLASVGLAVAARGGAPPANTTVVVVQPGDTLWSIATAQYPGDDVRVRIEDIEQANGLSGPTIEVGQTLKLPG